MVWIAINVLGISETRRPGEDDYKSDCFRIIHSGGEKSARSSNNNLLLSNKRKANCVEKIECEGDRLLMVKLKGETDRHVHHPSIYADNRT